MVAEEPGGRATEGLVEAVGHGLAGFGEQVSLACESDRIKLVRWDPHEHGTHRLVVRPSKPEIWPDIRVVAGDASASLSLRPTDGGDLAGALPTMYHPIFAAGGAVTLGLRMLGRKAQITPITIRLSPAGTP